MFTEDKPKPSNQTHVVVKALPNESKHREHTEVSVRLICGTEQQCDSVRAQINQQLKTQGLSAGKPLVDRQDHNGRDKRITFKVKPGSESNVEEMIKSALVESGSYKLATIVSGK